MLSPIRLLFSQPATPTEVLIFLLVAVVLFMLVAAAFYVALMTLFWSFTLRARVPLLRVFLPSRSQFREYLGEYLLALVTSLLLTLTLVVKDNVVQTVLHESVSLEELSPQQLALLFPAHGLPTSEELGGVELPARLTAGALLKPVVESGGSEGARVVIRDLVRPRIEHNSLYLFLNGSGFPFLIALLGLAYLAWLARRRQKMLEENPQAPPDYGDNLRRVFILAVCIALLLASPSLLTAESLADSAVAALEDSSPAPEEAASVQALTAAINKQQELYPTLRLVREVAERATELWQSFNNIDARVTNIDQSVTQLQTQCSTCTSDVAGLQSQLDTLRNDFAAGLNQLGQDVAALQSLQSILNGLKQSQDQLAGDLKQARGDIAGLNKRMNAYDEALQRATQRLDSLETALKGHLGVGYLIVNSAPGVTYQIRGSRSPGGERSRDLARRERLQSLSGQEPAVFSLSPGDYTVQADGFPPRSVTVEPGGVAAVWLVQEGPGD